MLQPKRKGNSYNPLDPSYIPQTLPNSFGPNSLGPAVYPMSRANQRMYVPQVQQQRPLPQPNINIRSYSPSTGFTGLDNRQSMVNAGLELPGIAELMNNPALRFFRNNTAPPQWNGIDQNMMNRMMADMAIENDYNSSLGTSNLPAINIVSNIYNRKHIL